MKKQKIQNKTNGQVEITAVIDGSLTPVVIAPGGYYIVNSIEQTNAIKIYIRKQIIEISEVDVPDDVEVFKPSIHLKDVAINEFISNNPVQPAKQEPAPKIEPPIEHVMEKPKQTNAKPIPDILTKALEEHPKRTATQPTETYKEPTTKETEIEEKSRLLAEKKSKQKDEKEKKKEKEEKERERLKKVVEKLKKQNNK